MNPRGAERPRPERRAVLVANEQGPGLRTLAAALARLSHEVVVCDAGTDADEAVERVRPDVVLVARLGSDERSLSVVEHFVHEGSSPVVAVLATRDPGYVQAVALRGAFGYVVGTDGRDVEAAIEIARARFMQYRNLQDAFARRARLEQAKGILMAQHGIDEREAFELLRSHARRRSLKVRNVADAVIESHVLFAPRERKETAEDFPLRALIPPG